MEEKESTGQLDLEREPINSGSDNLPCDRYVVGIGASAGGLEAIERFFDAVPDNPGVSFVIIQHLSPNYESHMEQLLGRRTQLPICRVKNKMKLEEDHIYLIPPGKTMIMSQGAFLLTTREEGSVSYPIDIFFRSLAADIQKSSIGIILSGTGEDGARGIEEINQVGGLVIAQDEESAAFSGMPVAAVETGVVNLILRPEEMPAAIKKYTDENLTPETLTENPPAPIPADALDIVFDELQTEFGIDFNQYKPSTIMRRIQRRIEANQDDHIDRYAERIAGSKDEVHALYRDLLIDVTHFFRDTEAFQDLYDQVIMPLVENSRDTIRVWVPGCATGEEAYTLAILFHDAFDAHDKRPMLKIFASDAHPDSIRHASEGIYSDFAIKNVSKVRLQKYFRTTDAGYAVTHQIRNCIVFTRHNLVKDVPFTRLHLITCRNLLIYLQSAAQRKIFSYFHFSLRTSGYLMLGPSESLGDLEEEFTPVNHHWKIFQKSRDVRLSQTYRVPTTFSSAQLPATTPALSRPTSKSHINRKGTRTEERDLLSVYDTLLDRFMPAGLLVSEEGTLLHVFSGGEKYLKIEFGRASNYFTDFIIPDLRPSVNSAFQHCQRERKEIIYRGISVDADEEQRLIDLKIDTASDPNGRNNCFVILFQPSKDGSISADGNDQSGSAEYFPHSDRRELERQLAYAKENLQATIEELETSNEELQATNEELIASNEELQSSNEELHSVNEELDTVNGEYQNKILELTELSNDTDNMLASTDIGVVFLDDALRLRKFTPNLNELADFTSSDLGRKITSIPIPFAYANFEEDLEKVRRSEETIEKEFSHADNPRRFLLRIAPYRSGDVSNGLVLTVIDVSSMSAMRERALELSEIVDSSNDAIIGFNYSGGITNWNHGAEILYGYSRKEAEGKNALDLIIPEAEAAAFMRELDKARLGKQSSAVTMARKTRAGHRLMVTFRLSTAPQMEAGETQISSIERDITDELLVRHDRDRLAQVMENTTNFVGICDREENVLFLNKAGREMIGIPVDEHTEQLKVKDFHPPRAYQKLQKEAMTVAAETGVWKGRNRLKHRDGHEIPVAQIILFQRGTDGRPDFFSTIIRDLSDEEKTYDKLAKAQKRSKAIANTLEAVIRNFPEMVVVLNEDREIDFASPEAKEFFGVHSRAGALPLELDKIVDRCFKTRESFLPTGSEGVASVDLGEGVRKHYLQRVSVLETKEGILLGAIITLPDVTEFRLLDDVKTNLIGAVGHELKNPVAGVSLSLNLALEGSLGELTELQRSSLSMAAEECDRIAQTIDTLLNLTRFESGQGQLHIGSATVQELVDRSIAANRLIASKSQIRFEKEVEDEDQVVSCDVERLLIVLNNFVSNAIKHSPPQSTVVIGEKKIKNMIRFEVSDSGPGVPDDLKDAVFTKFYKAPGNQKAGTGLGLNIASEFVKAHNGTIGIEDAPSGGATFYFEIPVKEVEEC